MKHPLGYRLIILIWLCLSFQTGKAEELSLSCPLKSLYTLNDTLSLEWTLSSERPVEEFMICGIEPPFSKDLTLISSEMDSEKSLKDRKIIYHFSFQFKPLNLGQIEIRPPELTVKDSSGKSNIYKGKSIKISVVTVFRRYRFLLYVILFFLAVLFPAMFFMKLKKKKELKRMEVLKAEKFESLKAEGEGRFSARLKSSSSFLIAGEYAAYCRNIFQALIDYLKTVYPDLPEVKEETALSLLKAYIPAFSHKKFAQYLYLTEEILYTGKTPMASDLDRLLILAKELVAEHKFHTRMETDTENQNNSLSF